MDQWLSGLLSTFARDLVCGAVDQLRYPCCFNGFVDDLQRAKDKLITTKDSVNDRVEHGKKQATKNAQVIHAWLEQEANPLKENVEDLLERARTDKTCCFGHCPNWIFRYRLAKKLEEKKVEVEKCIAKGSKYARYERIASLPGIQHLPWEKSLEFDSRQGAYEQLIEALKDDEVTMFGLYGMGGCGKTTMTIELMRTAEAEHLFDRVLFVPVSSNVEVRKIQDKIASALQFKFPEDGEWERAQRLCERLTLEKRTLVILDDVWQFLDFGEIGIPFGENNKNCKVMITTRLEAVCSLMDCQRMISLSTLADEEAWELFQKQANISENSPSTLKDLGRKISNECKGLPVAIAALAGTLKGKVENDWKVALNRLRNSIPVNIEMGLQNPYKCLEISYDNLDSEEAKALLLFCSVFPEDDEIPIEYLTTFAIGLGLAGEVGSYERARNEVTATKNKLISSSLLSSAVDDNKRECVKMHDLIRDVAQWIASKENKTIKCVLEKAKTLECSSIRYLWCTEFPNELDCTCIEFLRLDTHLEVSDEIFKGMERLRVLILHCDREEIGSLSTKSFKSLTSLRCLVLSRWELGDISSVGYMTKLESLMLFRCSFSELPDTMITRLTKLRQLYLYHCGMKKNPFEVIRRHQWLEELRYDEQRYLEGSKSFFYVGNHVEFFKMFSVPPTLQRYRMKFGSKFTEVDIDDLHSDRVLILSCFDTSNALVMELAKKSEVLLVANILGGAKNVSPDIFQKEGGGTMNCGWSELWLRYSDDIECLVDTGSHSWEVGTPFLELCKLRIEHMEHLGALYHGVPPCGLFEKLEQLYIGGCPMLTCILTPTIAQSLVQLQELKIYKCDGLKHVLEDDDSEISRHDDKLVFSKLKSLYIRHCSMLEYTFPLAFAQGLVQLESLEIDGCDKLEYVFGQGTHGGDEIQNELKIEIAILEKLKLTSNPNMMSIFPKYCSASCPSLREFYLKNCPDFDILSVDPLKASNWKNIEGTETTTDGEIPTSPKPILPTFGSQLATPLHIIPSSKIEDKIKESVQEAYTSKDNMKAAMSAGTKGNGLGVVAVSHTKAQTSHSQKMQNVDDDSIQVESNLMDKEGEIGVGFKSSIEVHPEACADTSSNHLSIVAELEAFKHYVDMDDAQIALLAEAIAVYPHLWKVLAKFSVRFQAWMLKTLADMLLFLRNESAASVTPQREKEFQKLCNEAIQLGFDKPWVDEMRKRVMFRDPGVDHAETRLNELLKRHDRLTEELCKIKDEIDNLRNFVGSQKKCFDFL